MLYGVCVCLHTHARACMCVYVCAGAHKQVRQQPIYSIFDQLQAGTLGCRALLSKLGEKF